MARVQAIITKLLAHAGVGALVLAALVVGYLLGSAVSETPAPAVQDQTEAEAHAAEVWTCSMHPQIRLPEPGSCPICGMDLIRASGPPIVKGKKVKYACSMFCVPPMDQPGDCPICGMEMVAVTDDASGGGDRAERTIALSAAARKLAAIQVAPVERKFVSAEIRLVGKIDYDETKLAHITSWVPGRLDRLYVDYTGIPVQEGDHLVYMYSPDLLAAQEELLQALQAVRDLRQSTLSSMKETAARTVDAVREKLRLWGLKRDQIDEIEQRGTPSDHITIYAPIGGIVIQKGAFEGMYVETGTRIYTIADLSQVWAKLDAYESDLVWIRYGQQVEFETEAYPGDTFTGTITFIDPVLDAVTRTVKVRVNIPNADGRLKPGMFVRARVRAKVAAGGKIMDAALAGKWMCPMHPEIVKDDAGSCDLCGMPLVRTESLGYVTAEASDREAPLVIPATAPLITGRRAVVYVAVPDEEGVFEGREIVLGPRAGNYYLVREGLAEGELVVVNGNFKLDSAIQILAKPSMMSADSGVPDAEHQPGEPADAETSPVSPKVPGGRAEAFEVPARFGRQLEKVFSAYFAAQQALSRDKLPEAREASKRLAGALAATDMGLLEGPAHQAWMKEQADLGKSAGRLAAASNIETARREFALLSESMAAVAARFGTSGKEPVIRFHCPMAFDNRGADWLQNKPGTENPYFGSAMFKCGKQTEVIVPGPVQK